MLELAVKQQLLLLTAHLDCKILSAKLPIWERLAEIRHHPRRQHLALVLLALAPKLLDTAHAEDLCERNADVLVGRNVYASDTCHI